MLKKYIDKHHIEDVPQNGTIIIEAEGENGEVEMVERGISNLPLALENDVTLANRNEYYEYIEEAVPEADEDTQKVTYEYTLENNRITKRYKVEECEQNDNILC